MGNTALRSHLRPMVASIATSGLLCGLAWGAIVSPFVAALVIVGHPKIATALAVGTVVVTGISFSAAMAALLIYQTKQFLEMELVPADEVLIHQAGAKRFVGIEGVGGWLYLTNHALRFKPSQLNIQRQEWQTPLTDIMDVQSCRMIGIFPTGLRIVLRNGMTTSFYVRHRNLWRNKIEQAKSTVSAETTR